MPHASLTRGVRTSDTRGYVARPFQGRVGSRPCRRRAFGALASLAEARSK